MSTNKNPLATLSPDSKSINNPESTIRLSSRPPTIISTLNTAEKTPHNSINPTGSISIDMFCASMDTSRKASSKATLKTPEIEKLKSYSTSKITLFRSTKKKNRTQAFHKENSLKDKSMSKMMENSWQPTTSDLDKLSRSTVDQSISTAVMTTQDSSIRKSDSLKALLSLTLMTLGPQLSIISGFLRKMPKWKSILRKNLEEEKSILKNSSFRTIEKSSSFTLDSRAPPSLSTIS